MINHILTLLTGSDSDTEGLAHGRVIAQSLDAQITFLKVLGIVGQERQGFVDPVTWQVTHVEAEASLNREVELARQRGLRAEGQLMEHASLSDVISYVQDHPADLVIAAEDTEILSPLTYALFTHLQTPLHIIRTGQAQSRTFLDREPKKIAIPLDGSQRAEYVLPLAVYLAEQWDAVLLLVHVIRRPEMPRRAVLNEEDAALINQVVERNREELAAYFEQLSRSLGTTVEIQGHLLVNDNVTRSLHEFFEQEGVDLIALSAHGYSGEPRWPYGSTASNLLAFGTTPVLVVQDLPRDFKSQASTASESRREFHKT